MRVSTFLCFCFLISKTTLKKKIPLYVTTVKPHGFSGWQSSLKDINQGGYVCKTLSLLGLQNPWDSRSLPPFATLIPVHDAPPFLQRWMPWWTLSTCHSLFSAVGPLRPRGPRGWGGAQGHSHLGSGPGSWRPCLVRGAGLRPMWARSPEPRRSAC